MLEEEIIQVKWISEDDWQEIYPNTTYPHVEMKDAQKQPQDEYEKFVKEMKEFAEETRKMKPLSFEKKQELCVKILVESIHELLNTQGEEDVKRMYNILIENETKPFLKENLSMAVNQVFNKEKEVNF